MNRKSLVLALALGLVVPILDGCTEEERTQREYKKAERQRKKAMTEVGDRAEAYMNAIRWRDYQAASLFYETIEDQLAYLQRSVNGVGQPTIENINVDFVLVDEVSERAEVRVTLTEVEYTTQKLGSRSETLLWYRSEETKPKAWFLVPTVTIEPQ
jgi:hypothetical protein